MSENGSATDLSRRALSLEVSPTVAVAQRAAALKAKGEAVLDFSVGEPDQPTPRHIGAAATAAIEAGQTRYTAAAGLPALRAAVAQRYRKDFKGSFSLKYILSPLVPDLTYNDLAIVDGQVASVEIARLLFVAHLVEDRDQLRKDLLAYCERDTWAMVRLVERLQELAG